MPEKLERDLKQQVAGKNWSEDRKNAYIYGTMRKTGWKPSTQKAFRGGLIKKPKMAKRGY